MWCSWWASLGEHIESTSQKYGWDRFFGWCWRCRCRCRIGCIQLFLFLLLSFSFLFLSFYHILALFHTIYQLCKDIYLMQCNAQQSNSSSNKQPAQKSRPKLSCKLYCTLCTFCRSGRIFEQTEWFNGACIGRKETNSENEHESSIAPACSTAISIRRIYSLYLAYSVLMCGWCCCEPEIFNISVNARIWIHVYLFVWYIT